MSFFSKYFQNGMAYIGLLFTLTLLGIALSQAAPLLSQQAQREKEAELLWVGQQYQKAILSYYQASPGAVKHYPKDISDLLEDRRLFGTTRHLRKPYADPLTGNAKWGMEKDTDGGIRAVYSLAEGVPIKQANFSAEFKRLEGARRYQQWVFGAY